MKGIKSILRLVIACGLLLGAAPARAQVNAEQVMAIGRNVMAMEDYMLAIHYFNQAIKAKPYLSDPYYYRALAKLNLEDYKGAEADCTLAIERNKFKSEAYKLRGFARQYLNRNEEAVADYDAGLKYYPLDRWFLYYKGVALTELERYESADSTFATLLRAYPNFEDGYAARARSFTMRGDTVSALLNLDKALTISRNILSARLMRAEIESKQKRWKDALADIDEALRLRPQDADLYINRAYMRYNDDDWFGAMSDYNYALELDPESTAARFNRALLRYETRDLTRAAEDLTAVLDAEPDNFHARYNRGLVLLEMQQPADALKDFERVAKRFPRYYTVYYAIAECKRRLGDLKGAGLNIRKADSLVEGYVKNPTKNPLDKPAIAAGKSNERGAEDEAESETEVMERFNRLVTIGSTSDERLAYNERSRGRVQDRNVRIEPLPLFSLTFTFNPTELRTISDSFRELNTFNQQHLLTRSIYLTNNQSLPADSLAIADMFRFVDDLSSRIDGIESPRPADLLGRGIAYTLLKNHPAAIADLTRAIELEPRFAVAYMARSAARMLDKEQETLAIADLDNVIRLAPKTTYAWFNKGVIYLQQQDYTSALLCFTEAINLDSTFGESYFNRGLTYLQVGNKQHAFADLSKAGELGIIQAYPLLKRMK